jgi:hypothetical protein
MSFETTTDYLWITMRECIAWKKKLILIFSVHGDFEVRSNGAFGCDKQITDISIIRTAFNLLVTDVQLNVLRIGIRSFSLRFVFSKRDKNFHVQIQISAIGNKHVTKVKKKLTYEEKSIFTTNLNGSRKYTCLIQKSRVHVADPPAKSPFIYLLVVHSALYLYKCVSKCSKQHNDTIKFKLCGCSSWGIYFVCLVSSTKRELAYMLLIASSLPKSTTRSNLMPWFTYVLGLGCVGYAANCQCPLRVV